MKDPYFQRKEVSNSDLSETWRLLKGLELEDMDEIFEFGNLVDAMITEPEKIDWFRKLMNGKPVNNFHLAKKMYSEFMSNAICKSLLTNCDFQKVSVRRRSFNMLIGESPIPFELDCRCKWDFFNRGGISGDIKTTAATSQKQFIAACHHFGYVRSRAWYMDLEDTDKDVIIGISKVNMKIFFLKIQRGDDLYNLGKKQYTELAFKHWMLRM